MKPTIKPGDRVRIAGHDPKEPLWSVLAIANEWAMIQQHSCVPVVRNLRVIRKVEGEE